MKQVNGVKSPRWSKVGEEYWLLNSDFYPEHLKEKMGVYIRWTGYKEYKVQLVNKADNHRMIVSTKSWKSLRGAKGVGERVPYIKEWLEKVGLLDVEEATDGAAP